MHNSKNEYVFESHYKPSTHRIHAVRLMCIFHIIFFFSRCTSTNCYPVLYLILLLWDQHSCLADKPPSNLAHKKHKTRIIKHHSISHKDEINVNDRIVSTNIHKDEINVNNRIVSKTIEKTSENDNVTHLTADKLNVEMFYFDTDHDFDDSVTFSTINHRSTLPVNHNTNQKILIKRTIINSSNKLNQKYQSNLSLRQDVPLIDPNQNEAFQGIGEGNVLAFSNINNNNNNNIRQGNQLQTKQKILPLPNQLDNIRSALDLGVNIPISSPTISSPESNPEHMTPSLNPDVSQIPHQDLRSPVKNQRQASRVNIRDIGELYAAGIEPGTQAFIKSHNSQDEMSQGLSNTDEANAGDPNFDENNLMYNSETETYQNTVPPAENLAAGDNRNEHHNTDLSNSKEENIGEGSREQFVMGDDSMEVCYCQKFSNMILKVH